MTMEEIAPMPGTDIQPWEVTPEDNCIQYNRRPCKSHKSISSWWPNNIHMNKY